MTALAYLEAALAGDRWRVDCPLRAELEAAGFPVAALRRVLGLGVPAAFLGQLTGAGDIASAWVDLSRDGTRWQPGGTDPRLLLAVREQGVLVDVVAFKTDAPRQWALRDGYAWALGHDAWQFAAERTALWSRVAVLPLYATPADWLRAGGKGLCVLDWDRGAAMLRGLGETVRITCDKGAAAGLRAKMARGGLPMVAERRANDTGLSLAEKFGRSAA